MLTGKRKAARGDNLNRPLAMTSGPQTLLRRFVHAHEAIGVANGSSSGSINCQTTGPAPSPVAMPTSDGSLVPSPRLVSNASKEPPTSNDRRAAADEHHESTPRSSLPSTSTSSSAATSESPSSSPGMYRHGRLGEASSAVTPSSPLKHHSRSKRPSGSSISGTSKKTPSEDGPHRSSGSSAASSPDARLVQKMRRVGGILPAQRRLSPASGLSDEAPSPTRTTRTSTRP